MRHCKQCGELLKDWFKPKETEIGTMHDRVLDCPQHGTQYNLKVVGCDVDFSEHEPFPLEGIKNLENTIKMYGEYIESGALMFDQEPASVQFLGALETKPMSRVRVKAYIWVPAQK